MLDSPDSALYGGLLTPHAMSVFNRIAPILFTDDRIDNRFAAFRTNGIKGCMLLQVRKRYYSEYVDNGRNISSRTCVTCPTSVPTAYFRMYAATVCSRNRDRRSWSNESGQP